MYIPVPGCRSALDSRTRATYRPMSVPCVVLGSRRVNGSNVGPFEADKVVSWLSSRGRARRKKRFRDDRHPLIEVINSELHDQGLTTTFQFQRNQRTSQNHYYFFAHNDPGYINYQCLDFHNEALVYCRSMVYHSEFFFTYIT